MRARTLQEKFSLICLAPLWDDGAETVMFIRGTCFSNLLLRRFNTIAFSRTLHGSWRGVEYV